MSEVTISEWAKVRTEFFEKLHTREQVEGEDYLRFSVNGNGCFVATRLEKAVNWLFSNIKSLDWITVVAYDYKAKSMESIHEHLCFRVKDDLQATFNSKKDEMFLITGIPCGHPKYLPNDSEFTDSRCRELLPLPPFAIILNKNQIEYPEICKEWVQFKFNNLSDNNVTWEVLGDNKGTPTDKVKWETFIRAAIERRCENQPAGFESLINETLKAFIYDYSRNYTHPSEPDEWLSLFIPGIHIPEYPFFMNGMLFSFNKLINETQYKLLKMWTWDICSQISVVSLLQRSNLIGAWRGLGDGKELKWYLNCFDSRVEGKKSNKKFTSKLKQSSPDAAQLGQILGVTPETPVGTIPNPPTAIHDGIEDEKKVKEWNELNDREVEKRVGLLRDACPSWMNYLHRTFGDNDKVSGIFALWCFHHRHLNSRGKITLSLADIIACSHEAGWHIDIDIDGKTEEKWKLLHKRLGWNIFDTKLSTQLVLDWLIKFPKTDKKYDKPKQLLTGTFDKPSWIMDVVVRGRHSRNEKSDDTNNSTSSEQGESLSSPIYTPEQLAESESTVYLNLLELALEDNELNKHLFTRMMLAASALVEDNLIIKPVWTVPVSKQPQEKLAHSSLFDVEAKKCLEELGRTDGDNVCWVLTGEQASRIIIHKTWS